MDLQIFLTKLNAMERMLLFFKAALENFVYLDIFSEIRGKYLQRVRVPQENGYAPGNQA